MCNDPSILTAMGGNKSKYVANGSGPTVVSSSPGRLCVVAVFNFNTAITIYDNASAASGDILFRATGAGIYVLNLVANNGITVDSPSGSAAVTIGYI